MKKIGYTFWEVVRAINEILFDILKLQNAKESKIKKALLKNIKYAYKRSDPSKYYLEENGNLWKASRKSKKY